MLQLGRQAPENDGGEYAPPSATVVTGYVGMPAMHRSHRGYITLFVNRRWFQDTSIAYGVIQAYHTLLPVGRYPVALIFVEIDPAEVDVNVHPTKAEVRFRDSHAVFGAVQRAVRRTLADHAPIPQIGPGPDGSEAPAPQMTWQQTEAWASRREALLGAGGLTQAAPFAATRAAVPIGSGQPAGVPDGGLPAGAAGPGSEARPALMPILRVVGQIGATYIVAEGPDGMYLIDQHAAHERVLYEHMLAEQAANKLAVQPLLEPFVLDLNPEQAAAVVEHGDGLRTLGVGIEPFGGGSFLVRSVPAILARDDPQAALVEIVDGLIQKTDVVGGAAEARLVTLICKRAAVKGGIPSAWPRCRTWSANWRSVARRARAHMGGRP